MFCGNCGKKIDENAKFCPYCGVSVNKRLLKDEKTFPDPILAQKKHKRIRTIVIGAVIIAAVGIGAVAVKQKKFDDEYNTYLNEAQQYLSDFNYEKAEVVLKQALDGRPEKKEAYIILAEVYQKEEKDNDATEILEKALEQVKLKKSEQAEIHQYVANIQDGQEILQYQSLYANETYNIYLKKNNGYRYIYSEADGVSMDAKMERVQSVFSYTGDKIKIEKSLVTTGGNGGFVDIYDSDSVYLPYAKRWVNGEEDKNKDAKEYYVYGDGKNYSDFDSYLEGYSSALGKALFDYGISMPIIEQTTSGQYPFFDIYLANAAKFDENLFNYQLQTDPYEYYENGKELEYTRIIKSIQVDTGKSEEDTDENATKSDEDSKKQGWRQAYIDFINSKEIQNEDYAEYM